jgi:hypothetical protein
MYIVEVFTLERYFVFLERRKIRLIEKQSQMSLSKKLTCKGTLRRVFYLSEAMKDYEGIIP